MSSKYPQSLPGKAPSTTETAEQSNEKTLENDLIDMIAAVKKAKPGYQLQTILASQPCLQIILSLTIGAEGRATLSMARYEILPPLIQLFPNKSRGHNPLSAARFAEKYDAIDNPDLKLGEGLSEEEFRQHASEHFASARWQTDQKKGRFVFRPNQDPRIRISCDGHVLEASSDYGNVEYRASSSTQFYISGCNRTSFGHELIKHLPRASKEQPQFITTLINKLFEAIEEQDPKLSGEIGLKRAQIEHAIKKI